MIELHENYFWHRRITQVAIALSSTVVLLYLLSAFGNNVFVIDTAFTVGILPAALAGSTFIIAVIANILSKKISQAHMPLLTQIMLVLTTSSLIHSTGGLESSFLALWVPTVIFVGIFGAKVLLITGAIPLTYPIWLLMSDSFTLPMGVTVLLIGEVPVILSSLLFSHLATQKEDSSYRRLANQFSQVSNKAEVVINAITNGVIALDKDGMIELINPEAQKLIGWESRDALKLHYKSVLKLVDENSNELTSGDDPVHQALSTNEEVRTENYKMVTNSGKKILISLVASPVGQPGSGVIIVFRDITKEKAEERQQAEFISTASHEMRTPVATIEGYLGLALNPTTAQIDEKARSYIMKAHEVAQHLGRLFQDLLDVTKAEDGRLLNNPKVVEVMSFVQDIVEGLRPQAEAKGLILVYKPAPEAGEINEKSNRRLNPVFYANVDNDHLREIVANLIENAIKYTRQGSISVDVTGDDEQVEVSVQDTGIGIPAEDLPHLFQKFYRVDNSDTREIGGTGLGLYLSRRLVEAMEGRIWAESTHGQGSTFFVSIPRIGHQDAMQLIEEIKDQSEQTVGPATSNPTLLPDSQPILSAAPRTNAELPRTAPSQPLVPAVPTPVPAQAYDAPQQIRPAQPTQQTQSTQVSAQPIAGPTLASIEQSPEQYLSRPRFNVPSRETRASPIKPEYNPGNQKHP